MEWTRNAFQVRFAHEGKLLDFRLPEELTHDPIRNLVVRKHEEGEGHWLAGKPESANAQGISRTEEMWLYLAPPEAEEAAAIQVLKALNDETLRAVVDPRWMAQSGAFYEIHPQDRENYPEEEKAFDLYTRAPARWIERLGLYGKWIYGDVATWQINLGTPTVSLYRTYRSRHHGYPYSWVPYARSGDSELLKAAESATRKLIDANYCHYVSPEVEESVGPTMHRRKGFWSRSLIPWTGRTVPTSRNYESKSDYLWNAWYLTGYERARENALDWGEQTKLEEPLPRRGALRIGISPRNHVTLLKSYLDMYEATFDPWFLVAAHAIAEGHRAMGTTHFWVPADRDFLRFTGDPKHRDHYMKYVALWGSADTNQSWATLGGVPMIEPNAYAWHLTGEDAYLRRVAHFVDLATSAVYDSDGPDYLKGTYTRQSSHKLFEGYYLQLFPAALAALHQSGQQRPVPIPNAFEIATKESRSGSDDHAFRAPTIAFQKEKGKPLALRLRAGFSPLRGDAKAPAHYRVLGPEGGEVLSGPWEIAKPRELEIPAAAPAGVYRLHVRTPVASKLLLPVCPTVDQPEVVELAPGEGMAPSRLESAFSFKVPAKVRRFWIEIEPPRGPTHIIVWTPAGKRAWDFHFRPANHPGKGPIRTEIEVSPEDAGQLWRITLPGSTSGFKMDPQIPPVYATSPTRWFAPQ